MNIIIPKPVHILHIVRDLDTTSGGPSRSVPALAEGLVEVGIECTVLFEDRGRETTVTGKNVRAEYVAVQRSSKIWRQQGHDTKRIKTLHENSKFDIIHSHGLWSGLNHSAARFGNRSNVPIVITPRGMLEPWCLQQKRLKKQFALWLYQRNDLHRAAVLHATSEAEESQLQKLGFAGKIVVVPNGTELPTQNFVKTQNTGKRRVLFLSRLHAKKGIDHLIRAWSAKAPSDWECVIAGPDEGGYLTELKQLHAQLGSNDSLRFYAAVEGDKKWELMRSADLFVLPSHSENFGIVIAEALACGVPVVTTKRTPWQELKTRACGWWIEDNTEALTATLKEALALTREELDSMGQRGKALIEEKYTWPSVAAKMKAVYAALLDNNMDSPEVFGQE